MGALFALETPSRRLSCLLILLLGATTIRAAEKNSGHSSKTELSGADIFNATNVIRIKINIPMAAMNQLRGSYWGGGRGGQAQRPSVKATVSDGTHVYTNVAVHLKGAAGSFQPVDSDPALTLNFSKFAPGQTFHGLHKISLNNSVQDPSFIEEKICREMFEAAGVPVPRADYAVVTLNQRNLGLHVLLEGYNKQFLHRYFKNVSGNLYDGGFCQDITEDLAVNSGDKPENRSDLQKLAAAAISARQNNRLDDLAKVLDIDRFLSMIALEVIQCHWDGYAMNRNNFRVYHDLDTDRMVFMPHGMDQMFGTSGHASTATPVMPPMQGIIARVVTGTAEGRRRYLERVATLTTNVFQVAAITNRVREIAARITPVIAEQWPQAARNHQMNVTYLCQNIVERGRALERIVRVPDHAMTFDTSGVARPRGWQMRSISGSPTVDSTPDENGKPLLHVSMQSGAGNGSWRTAVLLKNGHYTFEGLVKTQGVSPDGSQPGRGGADLRISGSRNGQHITGTTGWTPFSFSFDVEEPLREVELVCELASTKGEAWFDPATLKLKH